MNNLSLFTYTHTNTKDLHDAYFGRIKKFFPSLKNLYVTCNEKINFGNCIVYDDTTTHSQQMINALDTIETDYLIYSQEDYILFDYVVENEIENVINLLETDKSIPFVRLIQSGLGNVTKKYNDEFAYIDSENPYYFSTQISIWRKSVLKEMFLQSNVTNIRDEMQNSPFLKEINPNGIFHLKRRNQVGGHFNSYLYPYIATAVVRTKWNYSEYENELKDLFFEYQINPFDRGIL